MEKHKQQSNPMAMPTTVLGIIMIVMLVFMISINTQLTKLSNTLESGTGNIVAAAQPAAPTQPTAPTVAPSVVLSADDDAVRGDSNAPVEIIEFSDFECPFCARFYSDTLGQIEKNYIETGKVKLIFRDFPLGFHAQAQKASEAAECAADQDAFWEMHDMLFEKGVVGGVATFKQYAADLGLETDTFDTCLDSGEHAAEVQKDFADGQSAGVSGTPSFFINGKKIVGAQPYSVFQAEIEAALNG